MAQIVKYTAQQGLNPGGTPSAQVHSYEGTALEGLGQQIESAAAIFQQRAEQKEDFKAQSDKTRLDLRLQDQLAQRAQELEGDGEGFHDSFLRDVYTPMRDEFLNGLSPRVREKYETLLGEQGPDTERWSLTAATRERDQLYSWYDKTLSENQEVLATAIDIDPDAYEDLLQKGMDEIESSGLPGSMKEKRREAWERMAQVAHLNRMLEERPEEILKDLGADPRTFTPSTQFALLSRAVQIVESTNNPNAISEKGAVGLMQVMPDTAKDIARWMGDEDFDQSWSKEQITEFLSNPVKNKQYGDFYLKKMIRDYGKTGGLKAVLIGYNAGPKVAERWIASGFNDDVLPEETRKHIPKVMAHLPAGGAELGDPVAGTKRAAKFNPANVKLHFKEQTGTDAVARSAQESKLNPQVVSRVKGAFAALGIDDVRINSGYRSDTRNKKVGGAVNEKTGKSTSQHVHGNAMDIDVTDYSRSERIKIIEALSANGITGIGVGDNIIHADVGGRRVWGYATSAGGGPVPDWAKEVTDRHLEGGITTAGTPGSGGRYSSLPYDERQKFIRAADKRVTELSDSSAKASAVQKYEMRSLISNEIASINSTGQSGGLVDDTAVATILGEEGYMRYVNDRDVALRSYDAKDGLAVMSIEEMDERLLDYTPDPGSPTFADDQKVQAAIQKEVDRVTRLRSREPDKAAMEFPDVKQAWDALADDPSPEAAQEFIRLNLERQAEFGLKPGSERPLPVAQARDVGRRIADIPAREDFKDTAEYQAALLQEYDTVKAMFGDYAEEVIIQGLQVYKNVPPETAEGLVAFMEAINAGGDPFRSWRSRGTEEAAAAEELSFWGRGTNFVKRLITGEPDTTDAAPGDPGTPEAETASPEALKRAIEAVDMLGDDLTMSEEIELRRRYGDPAVDAALSRRGE